MRLLPCLLIALLLPACSPSPTAVAENYLKAIKSGKLTDQQKLFCIPSDAEQSKIKSAPTWSILGEEERESDGYKYKDVTVKVNDQTMVIRVWKTENAYQHQQALVIKLREQGIDIKNAVESRSRWTTQAFCVVVEEKN
jgi:hypothetical protein